MVGGGSSSRCRGAWDGAARGEKSIWTLSRWCRDAGSVGLFRGAAGLCSMQRTALAVPTTAPRTPGGEFGLAGRGFICCCGPSPAAATTLSTPHSLFTSVFTSVPGPSPDAATSLSTPGFVLPFITCTRPSVDAPAVLSTPERLGVLPVTVPRAVHRRSGLSSSAARALSAVHGARLAGGSGVDPIRLRVGPFVLVCERDERRED